MNFCSTKNKQKPQVCISLVKTSWKDCVQWIPWCCNHFSTIAKGFNCAFVSNLNLIILGWSGCHWVQTMGKRCHEPSTFFFCKHFPFWCCLPSEGKWFSVTENPDNEAKWDSSKRGTQERLEIAGSCYTSTTPSVPFPGLTSSVLRAPRAEGFFPLLLWWQAGPEIPVPGCSTA